METGSEAISNAAQAFSETLKLNGPFFQAMGLLHDDMSSVEARYGKLLESQNSLHEQMLKQGIRILQLGDNSANLAESFKEYSDKAGALAAVAIESISGAPGAMRALTDLLQKFPNLLQESSGHLAVTLSEFDTAATSIAEALSKLNLAASTQQNRQPAPSIKLSMLEIQTLAQEIVSRLNLASTTAPAVTRETRTPAQSGPLPPTPQPTHGPGNATRPSGKARSFFGKFLGR
jgi:hypothetical protein